MLNPDTIVDAVVAALRSIPALVTALGSDSSRISGFKYQFGKDFPLAQAVYTMPVPSMLVAWDQVRGGNFDGATVNKYRITIYVRSGNSNSNADLLDPASLWCLAMTSAVNGGACDIRYTHILPNLEIMDPPTFAHRVDENKLDYWVGQCDWSELGDYPAG